MTSGGRVVCTRCELAHTPVQRLRGLLGRRALDAGEGLLLRPCGSVHTAFMRAPIDAVFLDGDGRVLRVATLPPWRAEARRGARAVLELAPGSGLRTGERLELAS